MTPTEYLQHKGLSPRQHAHTYHTHSGTVVSQRHSGSSFAHSKPMHYHHTHGSHLVHHDRVHYQHLVHPMEIREVHPVEVREVRPVEMHHVQHSPGPSPVFVAPAVPVYNTVAIQERVVTQEVPVVVQDRIVTKEVTVPHDRIVEVPVEKVVYRDIPREIPVEIEKVVYRDVPVDRVVEREVPVERVVTKEVPVEHVVERVVTKEVPRDVERVVEVERRVEVPVEVEKLVEVVKEVTREVPVERRVEVPVDCVVEVPVDRVVERALQAPNSPPAPTGEVVGEFATVLDIVTTNVGPLRPVDDPLVYRNAEELRRMCHDCERCEKCRNNIPHTGNSIRGSVSPMRQSFNAERAFYGGYAERASYSGLASATHSPVMTASASTEHRAASLSIDQNVAASASVPKQVEEVGVGLRITQDLGTDSLFYVEEIIAGYAAARSGQFRVGDEVLSIQGRRITHIDEITGLTVGPSGTRCRISVRREGQQPFDIELIRSAPGDIVASPYYANAEPSPKAGGYRASTTYSAMSARTTRQMDSEDENDYV